MENYKDDYVEKLVKIYFDLGLEKFLGVCSELLNIEENNSKKRKSNGKLCEVLLYVLTLHYLRLHRLKGSVFHSMIIKDLDRDNNLFRTELDITLLTPCFCLTGECKSYKGSCTITKEGTFNSRNNSADIYKQSILHSTCLKKYLQRRLLSGFTVPMYGIFGFLFSNGTVVDKRTEEYKEILPILTAKSLFKYYDLVFSNYTKPIFDYKNLTDEFLSYCNSLELHREHSRYLGYGG